RTVLINDGAITAVNALQVPENCEVVDAAGAYLVPAFIDLQVYGGGGRLFSAYPEPDSLRLMDEDLSSQGVAGFLACIATNTDEVLWQSISAAKAYRSEAKALWGLHLEGPYLNVKRRGAHVAEYIRKAQLDELKRLIDHADGVVKMMTVAAEEQDDDVIDYLLDTGIILSLGHSDAGFDQATAAYDRGFRTTTHLFNAMSPIHHRAPGIPVALFGHHSAMSSIIADGFHIDFEVVRMAHRLLGERLFLITDAVVPCDEGPYRHRLENGRYVTPDGTMSGSSISMLDAVRNCVMHCGITLAEALRMASLYPAKLMNMADHYGRIDVGANAGLMLLSEDLRTVHVFRA
ncbi:N-acetylglucosamine-6-phosphate deacetylase, partial [Pedobacter sp. JY14-1]|uniref:N-acetylglucosamine-6-phosphate deacetylase n=1 Tax=Pedobacter sp. JY14-1 TaxID=3034151 RepID=UPI0023E2F708